MERNVISRSNALNGRPRRSVEQSEVSLGESAEESVQEKSMLVVADDLQLTEGSFKDKWVLDTCCFCQMIPRREFFSSLDETKNALRMHEETKKMLKKKKESTKKRA